MKKIKFLSSLLSCAMTFTVIGTAAANAEETKLYTYQELLSMSKEEFFELPDGENKYNAIKIDLMNAAENISEPMNITYVDENGETVSIYKSELEYFGFSTDVYFRGDAFRDERYSFYNSEKKIIELFGGSDEINIHSPLVYENSDAEGHYFGWNINVRLDEFQKDSRVYSIEELESIDDEYFLNLAKADFCLDQVCDFSPINSLIVFDSSEVISGDVNSDNKITVSDAAFLARKLAQDKAAELDSNLADFNGDENIDVRDCARLARYVSAKSLMRLNPLWY